METDTLEGGYDNKQTSAGGLGMVCPAVGGLCDAWFLSESVESKKEQLRAAHASLNDSTRVATCSVQTMGSQGKRLQEVGESHVGCRQTRSMPGCCCIITHYL